MAQASVTVRGALAALCLVAAACAGINVRTNSFATLAEAVAAGAVENGWLPAGLPPGTREIRTAHVPGTNDCWGLFDFPESDREPLRALLQPQEVPLAGRTVSVPGRIEWWPIALRGTLDPGTLADTGLKAHLSTDRSRIIAVNWNQGRAYYWPAR